MNWWDDQNTRDIVILLGMSGAVAFILLIWVFAFYW